MNGVISRAGIERNRKMTVVQRFPKQFERQDLPQFLVGNRLPPRSFMTVTRAAMPRLTISFDDKKMERRANWLVKQFAREKALVIPESPGDYMALVRERGLSKQYRTKDGKAYFPTEAGWNAFIEFIRTLQNARPFSTRATVNDVYGAYITAFANMISDGLLPTTWDDLSEYISEEFINDLYDRTEDRFYKISGVQFDFSGFTRIGQGWIGRFDCISFEALQDSHPEHTKDALNCLAQVFQKDTPVICGGAIAGTSDRVDREDTRRCELILSILVTLLNMTYENSFSLLWSLRRVEKPEHGKEKQFSFGVLKRGYESRPELSIRTQFSAQEFHVDEAVIERWSDSLLLTEFNKIVSIRPGARSELQGRIVNAILFFRQASLQVIPEMQMSTLWVCVESLLTVTSDKVLVTNIPGLVAVTAWSLRKDAWPDKADTIEQLKFVFKKHYKSRSRTFHHGGVGHVTVTEVQEFSVVVSNLVVAMVNLTVMGYKTTEEVLDASLRFVNSVEE